MQLPTSTREFILRCSAKPCHTETDLSAETGALTSKQGLCSVTDLCSLSSSWQDWVQWCCRSADTVHPSHCSSIDKHGIRPKVSRL